MATYVVGDVQGCFTTLKRLLERIEFEPDRDRLWLAGDLVNRGPDSLAVLRWARDMGPRVVAVIGNHDLHLIAHVRGQRALRPRDSFDGVMSAPDRDELVDWLLERPLFHREGGHVMVHAGILPGWTLEETAERAAAAEQALRDDDVGPEEKHTIAVLTRLRTCRKDGQMCASYAGPPEGAPQGCRPWYELASIPKGTTLFFGHWAALGLHLGERAVGLDSGCVWGNELTAIRLEDRQVFQEPSELSRAASRSRRARTS